MGLALPSLIMLLNEHKARPFSGTVLQLGRQDIYFDYATLQSVAQQMGVSLCTVETIGHRPNEWTPGVKTLDDITLFKSLGFDLVQSTDNSDYEQADFIADFNQPIPLEMHNRFDVVFDGGSLEHIFHVPNALTNFHAMLKVGGRIIHHVPTHNFVDHGFYCFSPTLFQDYYEANKFADIRGHVLGIKLPFKHNEAPKIFPYEPGMLEPYSVGGITKEKFQGCEVLSTVFSATKTPESLGNVIPTQRRYQQWWAKAKAKEAELASKKA